MAFLNPSNQLIQIDTGNVLNYCWNPSSSPIQPYANIGEVQVLGQRYVGYSAVAVGSANPPASNPAGSPAVYMLVKYLATSATTLANWRTANAPAPVYWTDNTFTTVTGISTEGIGGTTLGLNFPAGYLMANYVSLPNLTLAQLLGGYVFVQVAGYLPGAYNPLTGTAGIGNWIEPYAGIFSSQYVVSSTTAPTYQPFGRQLTAVASGLCDVLVGCDIF
jgi:hypothetical protein